MAAPVGSLKSDATTVKEGWLQKRGMYLCSVLYMLPFLSILLAHKKWR